MCDVMIYITGWGEVDPTGKIARQVGWLNRNATLQEKISFNDVVELHHICVSICIVETAGSGKFGSSPLLQPGGPWETARRRALPETARR